MLRFEISPNFKAQRIAAQRGAPRTTRATPCSTPSNADGVARAAVILSLPATILAISLFTAGGAAGPHFVANVKQKAFGALAELRLRDPFLRRPGVDYTPTGTTCAGDGCGHRQTARTKFAPLLKAPANNVR